MLPCCSSFLIFLLRQSSHRSGGGTWLWQELRWRKCWRAQLLRKRLIGWTASSWHPSLDPRLPSPPSTPPPSIVTAPQDSVDWWRETKPSQLHLVIICHTPAASYLLVLELVSACLFKDPHSTMTNDSFFSICQCVHMAVRWIHIFFFIFLTLQCEPIKTLCICLYILHGLFPHGDTDLTFSISLLWKTKILPSSVRWNALNHVVTIALNSLPSNPMMAPGWQVTRTIEGTSPSICAVATAPTLPRSNLLSLPVPPFHPSLLPSAIQQSFAQRREEKVEAAGFLKAVVLKEVNSADKGRREWTMSNRGYKKFIAHGKEQGVILYVNCSL